MTFDFDREIPRAGTASLKYDGAADYFGSAEVIPMWVADMDFAVSDAITRSLKERAAHPVFGYTLYPDSMYEALTSWMKKRHGWEIERSWILMCPGVVTALHATVLAVTQPDEAVIVQSPVYAPFYSCVTTTGRCLVLNPLKLEDGRYTIDFDHLEQCAADGARLLLLCSPHNPVGRVWTRDELGRIMGIARRHDLIILADEIHADLVYPGTRHTALATLANESNSIITAVAPSKTFNIPGLGLSALIVPNSAHRTALRMVFDQLHIQACNPFSITAFEAAYRDGEPWLEGLLAYLQDTRNFVRDYLSSHLPGIHFIEPEGTFLLWLDCRSLGMGNEELNRFFVHEAKVGLSPGMVFGMGGSGFMRMNIGTPRRIVATALERIKCALEARQGISG
ncbi:MAG TPA: pyridoxal phosphate-dependent aminotransferase [Gallionellaceae bacterium]|nr:pyridoxal phosphate-dependent aminotransferase [Gallionellaceae bacterium]